MKEPNGKANQVYIVQNKRHYPKKIGKRLLEVGYARNSIWTRMSDCRSAYGGIPFKLYCLIQIPAGVFGKGQIIHC